MTDFATLVGSFMPWVGGLAGLNLIYCVVMIWFARERHLRESRLEHRQIRQAQMLRDLWFDWVRRKT